MTEEKKIIGASIEKMRAELDAKGGAQNFKCEPVYDGHRQIIAWEFPVEGQNAVVRVGPLMFPWFPHQPTTWPHRYMTTKAPITLRKWNQKHPVEPNTAVVELPIGTRVKIVMASRFGDVGITDALNTDHGYHARIDIDKITDLFENFGMEA